MKKKFTFLISAIFILICISSIVLSLKYQKLIGESNYNRLALSANHSLIKEKILSELRPSLIFDGVDLAKSDSVFSFEDSKMHTLQDLVYSDNALILRISQNDCKSCVDSTLSALSNFYSEFEEGELVILTDKKNIRDIVVFSRFHKIQTNIYYIEHEFLERISVSTPYFFLLKDQKWVINFHLIHNGNLSLTNDYLKIIASKISRSRNAN